MHYRIRVPEWLLEGLLLYVYMKSLYKLTVDYTPKPVSTMKAPQPCTLNQGSIAIRLGSPSDEGKI